jgi:hypothetical protein
MDNQEQAKQKLLAALLKFNLKFTVNDELWLVDDKQKVKEELISRLKTISEDEDFILTVLMCAKDMVDRKLIISYIDHTENVTYENMLWFALALHNLRKSDSSQDD